MRIGIIGSITARVICFKIGLKVSLLKMIRTF